MFKRPAASASLMPSASDMPIGSGPYRDASRWFNYANTDVQFGSQYGLFLPMHLLADGSSPFSGDTDGTVRQAAAWSLGRIGTAEARTALLDAEAMQDDDRVLDAIRMAMRSVRR